MEDALGRSDVWMWNLWMWIEEMKRCGDAGIRDVQTVASNPAASAASALAASASVASAAAQMTRCVMVQWTVVETEAAGNVDNKQSPLWDQTLSSL